MTVNVSDPALSALGETTATARLTGSDSGGTIYAAVRTTGPYGSGDRSAIKNGTGAVWHGEAANVWRASLYISGMTAGTTQYFGAYGDDGTEGAVLAATFSTPAELPAPTGGRPLPVQPTERGN